MKGHLLLVACLVAASSAAYIGGRVKRDSFDCLSKWQTMTAQSVQEFSVLLSNTTVRQLSMDIVHERFDQSFRDSPASTTNKSDCDYHFKYSGTLILILSELALLSGRFRSGISSPSTDPQEMSLADCLKQWKANTTIWMSDYQQYILSDEGKNKTEAQVIVRFNLTSALPVYIVNLSTEWGCGAWFVSAQIVFRILYDLYLFGFYGGYVTG